MDLLWEGCFRLGIWGLIFGEGLFSEGLISEKFYGNETLGKQNLLTEFLDCICWVDFIITVSFSGFYWIDPNGGLPNDALRVRCEHRTNSTCLYPTKSSQVTIHLVILIYYVNFFNGKVKSA